MNLNDHIVCLARNSTNHMPYLQSDKGGYPGKLNMFEKRSQEDANVIGVSSSIASFECKLINADVSNGRCGNDDNIMM